VERRGEMSFKAVLVVIILILAAFGAGFGYGFWKLYTAEKEWAVSKGEMQSKINSMAKELALFKAREKLWEMPQTLSEAITHMEQKNYGLAAKTLEGAKEAFLAAQNSLGGEMKARFDFFLPALEEAKKEAENLGPNAPKRVEELIKLFEEAMKTAKKGDRESRLYPGAIRSLNEQSKGEKARLEEGLKIFGYPVPYVSGSRAPLSFFLRLFFGL
jgi:hypothetical protein